MCTMTTEWNATKAIVDAAVTTAIEGFKTYLSNSTSCAAKVYETFCGAGKVKTGVTCNWACAYGGMVAQTTFGCAKATVCATNNGVQLPKCSSMTEMMTAVCDKTAAEIATMVEAGKAGKQCADDGFAFSPPPPPPPAVPKNTTFFVSVTVTLPYTKAEFDQAKQDKYTAAMAATAGTIAANVVIESITEKRRRAGAVDVKTKVASSRHVPVVSHAGIHHDDQQSPLCGTLTRAHSYLFYRSLRAMPRASISFSQPLALAMPSRRN
jgi:hypothetical protein